MKTSLLVAAGATFALTGCSVMHFKNGPVEPVGRTVETWHHNLALSLYEVSPPLNMGALCADKQWSVVTSKKTLATGLAGMASGKFWDPHIVTYVCGQ